MRLLSGYYQNGFRHGVGTYRFKVGGKYQGEYDQGKKHGQGTFWYPDGSRYEGSWVDDQRNGTGTYYYPSGDTYEGEWYEHKRHGQGLYTYAESGAQYRGTWDQGKRKGPGELLFKNHKYTGYFDDDLPSGTGKYRFDIGCSLHGKYEIEEELIENEQDEDDEPVLVMKPKWITKGKMTLTENY